MALFEALYGRQCGSPVRLFEVALLGLELVMVTLEKVRLRRRKQKIAQSQQKSFFALSRRPLISILMIRSI